MDILNNVLLALGVGNLDISSLLHTGLLWALNIGAVAAARQWVYKKGKAFLASGRMAVVGVYLASLISLSIQGGFEQWRDASALAELFSQAGTMAIGLMVTYGGGKSIGQLLGLPGWLTSRFPGLSR